MKGELGAQELAVRIWSVNFVLEKIPKVFYFFRTNYCIFMLFLLILAKFGIRSKKFIGIFEVMPTFDGAEAILNGCAGFHGGDLQKLY